MPCQHLGGYVLRCIAGMKEIVAFMFMVFRNNLFEMDPRLTLRLLMRDRVRKYAVTSWLARVCILVRSFEEFVGEGRRVALFWCSPSTSFWRKENHYFIMRVYRPRENNRIALSTAVVRPAGSDFAGMTFPEGPKRKDQLYVLMRISETTMAFADPSWWPMALMCRVRRVL